MLAHTETMKGSTKSMWNASFWHIAPDDIKQGVDLGGGSFGIVR